MLCIFNTFTSKYFHFAHVILTMLSSTYHFWGVHNLYQAKSAKLNIGEQSKVGLFFFFLFSLFVFYLSFFVIRFSLFVIRFLYSFFTFGLSPFVSAFRFSLFVFHFFDVQNPILKFKIGRNIAFWHSKSYFDIWTGAEYRILTFKILFWHSESGWISYFDIQNPIFTCEIGPNISYFDIQNPTLSFELLPNIVFWHSKSYFGIRNWTEVALRHTKSYFERTPDSLNEGLPIKKDQRKFQRKWYFFYEKDSRFNPRLIHKSRFLIGQVPIEKYGLKTQFLLFNI